ncbi:MULTISPECIES: TRAP transporter small permease [Halomonas]|uniref:TRAP transporter small permease n=1 Tax=Halomonas TaxID=2745 RepID=UPI001A8E3308|nr:MULTISPECIES: TRAP transporter small permease subunit [Halomonas]MBN8412084.1 TRAP transporter small permease subunit [Halomonas litopenaei]MBY5924352.1 TRAP transporter small permease subunit [Halomonas sp. DP4Y7-2]MBY6231394.1 TRAP transporter small permease subunit [Halomonas sp. DP4Y7-1]
MAITSTATPKDNRWHALRLRWDAVDRRTERWLLLTFYALIILTIAVEVIRRFVLNYSSVWGEELARYAFIYLAWLAAAAAVRDRAHIRIDVLINLGGPRMKRLGWWITDVCTLVLAVWALYLSVAPVLTSIQFGSVTPGLRVSQALFLAAIPMGFLLIAWRVIQCMLADVRRMQRGDPVFDGQKLFD